MYGMRSFKNRFVRPVRRDTGSALKLTIELVPEPCFYSNLRNQIPQSEWDKLRKQVYANYDHRCGICGAKSKTLHCHEIWHYNDRAHIQKLEGFIALCPLCHHCKHIGYARLLAEQGRLNLKRVIDHFCRVNACSYQAFRSHEDCALRRCTERNRYHWKTDLGNYATLMKLPVAPTKIVISAGRHEVSSVLWHEQALLKIAPTKEQVAELEAEFYHQLELYYVFADKMLH